MRFTSKHALRNMTLCKRSDCILTITRWYPTASSSLNPSIECAVASLSCRFVSVWHSAISSHVNHFSLISVYCTRETWTSLNDLTKDLNFSSCWINLRTANCVYKVAKREDHDAFDKIGGEKEKYSVSRTIIFGHKTKFPFCRNFRVLKEMINMHIEFGNIISTEIILCAVTRAKNLWNWWPRRSQNLSHA